jgi:hypothetical protein
MTVGKYVLQIPADDGCIYVYDIETQLLRKVCDITQIDALPEIVKETLSKAHLFVKVKEREA